MNHLIRNQESCNRAIKQSTNQGCQGGEAQENSELCELRLRRARLMRAKQTKGRGGEIRPAQAMATFIPLTNSRGREGNPPENVVISHVTAKSRAFCDSPGEIVRPERHSRNEICLFKSSLGCSREATKMSTASICPNFFVGVINKAVSKFSPSHKKSLVIRNETFDSAVQLNRVDREKTII
jgi:hypothetical protein